MQTDPTYLIKKSQLDKMANRFESIQTLSNGINLECIFLPLAPDCFGNCFYQKLKEQLEIIKNAEKDYEDGSPAQIHHNGGKVMLEWVLEHFEKRMK